MSGWPDLDPETLRDSPEGIASVIEWWIANYCTRPLTKTAGRCAINAMFRSVNANREWWPVVEFAERWLRENPKGSALNPRGSARRAAMEAVTVCKLGTVQAVEQQMSRRKERLSDIVCHTSKRAHGGSR